MLNEIDVLGAPGHLTLAWDPKKRGDAAKAKKEFAALQKKGYAFFTQPRGAARKKAVKEFDPALKKVTAFEQLGKKTTAIRPVSGG